MNVELEQEQVDLLTEIVEEHRRVPRERRDRFHLSNTQEGSYAFYPKALDGWQLPVVQGDLDVLASHSLVTARYDDRGRISSFTVRPEGLNQYDALKRQHGDAAADMEAEVRRYLDAEAFSGRFPRAYAKWRQAEEALWGSESAAVLTTIGHHCREATQLFADALVNRYHPSEVDSDPSHTVARVRSVLALMAEKPSNAEAAFLDALLSYWGAVVDLSQRQEHGALKGGDALLWEDGRRLVFQAAVVMFELDRSVRRALG